MSDPHIGRAYDAAAPTYDRDLAGDRWMRRLLWQRYLEAFRPGQHVLDVGCGTGIDALFLAQRGLHVTGIDISPGMAMQLQAKVERSGLSDRVRVVVGDVTMLNTWPPEMFDGVLAAFASLNTLSLPELAAFASNIARLLRPGGRVVLHLLNRLSLWEGVDLVRRGQWHEACRRRQQAERTFFVGGQPVRHFLYFPDEVYRAAFAPFFRLHHAEALGVLRPPHTVRRVPPTVVAVLTWLERRVNTRLPFLRWGRFFLLDMERHSPILPTR